MFTVRGVLTSVRLRLSDLCARVGSLSRSVTVGSRLAETERSDYLYQLPREKLSVSSLIAVGSGHSPPVRCAMFWWLAYEAYLGIRSIHPFKI